MFDDDLIERMSPEFEAESEDLEERHLALRGCLQKLCPQDRDLLDHRYVTASSLQEYAQATHPSCCTLELILLSLRAAFNRCIERQLHAALRNTGFKKSDHHVIPQVLDETDAQQTFESFQQRMRMEPELVN